MSDADLIPFAIVAGFVLLISVGIPMIWLGSHRRATPRFFRVWMPVAIYLSIVLGVAAMKMPWSDKAIIAAVLAPVTVFSCWVGNRLFQIIRQLIEDERSK
ncbi:MAG: hypothetical protein HYX90_02845 [Chloroflexi bacterium]|nr:hypothetical protein [Chloroflexota bacterium]